jgi:hypothetical protein
VPFDDALDAISEGLPARTSRNAFSTDAPDWLEHEQTGKPYFFNIDFSANDQTEALSLRKQAIKAIDHHAELLSAYELRPSGLRWRYESLPLTHTRSGSRDTRS